MSTLTFPSELQHIPADYVVPMKNGGHLVELDYQTKESFHYEDGHETINKRAIAYLPAGYDEKRSYNVFYLMHGGWSDETTYLGTPKRPSEFKNVLDHAISDGLMTPMIVVCPTYNNLSDQDSSDYGLALALTANYHHELIHDLLPAVANHFSTYARSEKLDDLKASRDHRAFCGFSMGSVTTWRTFENALDYFRYFFPSSGTISSRGTEVAEAVDRQGHSWHDFYIFAASGTQDFAYPEFKAQINSMEKRYPHTFHYANNEQDGNLYHLVAPGGTHSRRNALEDFYNAMIRVWKEG